MKNGHLIKEKTEYFWEQFKSQEGLWDFLVGSPIFAFLILKFYDSLYNAVQSFWAQIGVADISFIHWYITLLSVGIILKIAGLYLSRGLNILFKQGKKRIRKVL